MEHLALFRAQQLQRLHSLASDVGRLPNSVLFCQIWTSFSGRSDPRDTNPVLLRVEAQSSSSAEAVCAYAHSSATLGIRKKAMELLGDCHLKGATRLIEDIAQADASQHPRDKLPGDNIPACSAIFLPVFDPADPFSRRAGCQQPTPSALLEVLVCKSVQQIYNHADLINRICHIMDTYQFGVSADASAFREWSMRLAASGSRTSSPPTPSKPSPRSSLSRTSSVRLLSSSSDSNEMLAERPAPRQLHSSSPYPESSWLTACAPSVMQPT